jgi:hypothetical protein
MIHKVPRCEVCDKDATRVLSFDMYNALGGLVQVRGKYVCDYHSTALMSSKELTMHAYQEIKLK